MRERVKSLILLVLVFVSLYLTTRLMFGQPYLETASAPDYVQLTFGSLKLAREQVYPSLRFNDTEVSRQLLPWSPTYRVVWNRLSFLLDPVQLPEILEAPVFTEGKSLQILFPVAADPILWFADSTIESLQVQSATWFEADSEAVWYYDIDGQWWRAEGFSFPSDFAVLASVLFTEAESRYAATAEEVSPLLAAEEGVMLMQEIPVMSRYLTTIEPLDADKLLRSIFINMAMVRRIEERDGAVIYTDGQRGLRLFPHGEIEFTAPENEPGTEALDITEILRETAQYLHLMGGWPNHLYVEKVHINENSILYPRQRYTQEVTFLHVQQGYPVVSSSPPLRLLFSDRGIIYYRRYIYHLGTPIGSPQPLVAPQAAFAAAANILGQRVDNVRLVDVSPVYYLDDASIPVQAHPAWLLTFDNGQTAVMNGFSGQFVKWLE